MKNIQQIKHIISLFTIAFSFCACANESFSLSYAGPADLTITNLSTGEVIQKSSEESTKLIFRHGDILQLKFTPPEEFEKKRFTVNFQVLDKESQVNQSPYLFELTSAEDVPVGTYVANCSAMCELWSENSSCKQSIPFRVE